MTSQASQFKLNNPSLSNRYDIAGMIQIILSNGGSQWSDEGSFAIRFDDGSTYNSHIISNYFIDTISE